MILPPEELGYPPVSWRALITVVLACYGFVRFAMDIWHFLKATVL